MKKKRKNLQESIRELSRIYAHTVLPDDMAPFDPRSVLPPGTVDMHTEYLAAQICAAVWFEEGFTFAMKNPDKPEEEYREYILDITKGESEKIRNQHREAFFAGASCYKFGKISIQGPENKVTTITISWNK